MMEAFVPEREMSPVHLDIVDTELWINDPASGSYWPFMPFLSQLETLPSGLESSNLQ